jgi:hypothetical protein
MQILDVNEHYELNFVGLIIKHLCAEIWIIKTCFKSQELMPNVDNELKSIVS